MVGGDDVAISPQVVGGDDLAPPPLVVVSGTPWSSPVFAVAIKHRITL